MARLAATVTAFLACFSVAAAGQKIVSSVPAPQEMFGRSGLQPSMVGCGTDETISAYLQLRHEILKFGINGGVSARIDTTHLLESEETWIESLAPGPNGEVYILAAKAKRFKERGSTFVDGHPTLFRFDANGSLIIARPLAKAVAPKLAVFDSGSFLTFDPGPPAQAPEAVLYSGDGAEMKRIDLSGTALDRRSDKKANESSDEKLVPIMMTVGNRAFIATGIAENAPTITIVRDDGKVVSSTSLKIPSDFSLMWTRMKHEQLFSELECKPGTASCRDGSYYAEFDPSSGHLLGIQHDTGPVRRIPLCNTSSGMSFLNAAEQTLEVMTAAPR